MRLRRRSTPSSVFVLGTGRCGTVTFIRACEHLDNFTAGHETRSGLIGADRFAYPDGHIEADNRLAWFLGGLSNHYDDRGVLYVHLKRDPADVAASFLKRWNGGFRASIIRAFGYGILMKDDDWQDPLEVCRFYVDTVTSNIDQFLSNRPSMTLYLEGIESGFPEFLDRIGASGDLHSALAEWEVRHNASR